MVIEYTQLGKTIADDRLDWFVNNVQWSTLMKENDFFHVSTYTAISAILTAIATDKIDHTKVIFIYDGIEYAPNEYGVILDFPVEDPTIKLAEDRLIAAAKRKQQKRLQ